ncbi:MAG: TrmH family RNA methyltransferase [Synechococcaceae cyanobacterium ELA445]
MPLLPRRFERLKAVLNQRMGDLTVVLEAVDKPHNLSAILRSCDAVGAMEAHVVSLPGRPRTFNDTAKGSQKWVPLHPHPSIEGCLAGLKARCFRVYGTHLGVEAVDYRHCDFKGPTAFLLGAEKWGLSEAAKALVDQPLFIPTSGMVQSLNVSVAAAILLFEALRQRELAGLVPSQGEGVPGGAAEYGRILFEWAYPQVAAWCRKEGRPYPELTAEGEIAEVLPRTVRLRC